MSRSISLAGRLSNEVRSNLHTPRGLLPGAGLDWTRWHNFDELAALESRTTPFAGTGGNVHGDNTGFALSRDGCWLLLTKPNQYESGLVLIDNVR